ncbi:hypothetical protein HMSSN139_23460 [Paenibacillus sp. HMSSN-139]|nr:hypothetical protein HMSSN139_23460 [Paenibacillus sp. HMSSN-139]
MRVGKVKAGRTDPVRQPGKKGDCIFIEVSSEWFVSNIHYNKTTINFKVYNTH